MAESAVILSTCNRTEIYLHHRQISPQECKQWQTNCINWFANIHQLSVDELNKSIYTHQNQQAANHLMRVACGLDSLILGEPQILGQVKQAFQISEDYYQAANIPLSSTLFSFVPKKPLLQQNVYALKPILVKALYRWLMQLVVWHVNF